MSRGRRLLLPRHVGKFLGEFWRGGLGHFEFWILRRLFTRRSFVIAPGSDARLQAMMFGGLFVARLRIKQREVGVNELLFWPKLLGFMALGNGGLVIAFPIIGHAQRELCVEVRRVS